MHARIDDTGRVAELITHDPAGRYHPSIQWIPVPEALEGWVDHTWSWDGDTGDLVPVSLDALVTEAAARVAAERWRRQTAGVNQKGHRWHSDSEGRSSITDSLALATESEAATGEAWSTTWKTMDGFVVVTRSDLVAAGLAVGSHVQACFGREAEIVAALQTAAAQPGATAADIIALFDTEIGQGWPTTGTS